MKVRMLQALRGPGGGYNPGDTLELEAEEAARWCSKGIAVPVQQRKKRATKPKPEQAVKQ